jgi:hypothetical protein
VRVDLAAQAAHQHVWRPDAVGSICFLVASALAWFKVCHRPDAILAGLGMRWQCTELAGRAGAGASGDDG